jgi:acyl-CoA thioesterase-1
MLKLFLPLLLSLAALPAAAQQQTILVLGDSLSTAYGMGRDQGWTALLERRLAAEGYPYRVVNASISGDTTQGGLARAPAALARHAPDIVVVELGGNDGLRGISPEQAKRNLQSIVEQAHAAGSKVVLVGVELPPNYGAAFNRRFGAVYSDVSRQYQLPLTVLSLSEALAQPGLIQADGVHPTAKAQPLILDQIWPLIEPLLEKSERRGAGR